MVLVSTIHQPFADDDVQGGKKPSIDESAHVRWQIMEKKSLLSSAHPPHRWQTSSQEARDRTWEDKWSGCMSSVGPKRIIINQYDGNTWEMELGMVYAFKDYIVVI